MRWRHSEDTDQNPETVALCLYAKHSKSNDSLATRNVLTENPITEDDDKCPETSPHLVGPVNINLSIVWSLEDISYAYPNVQGGHFHPADCSARQRIAVIIPFRRRETHLAIWLFYMHQFLQRQQADYGIYVIEQHGDLQFNRAKLMNVGFAEASKDNYNCFIFSDVDIVPLDDRNYYRCSGNPRHMANALDKFNFRLLYGAHFGGVNAFSKEQFLKVNGFSNKFWGWGGEDDELYARVIATGMKVERPDAVIARSKMILHRRDPGNETNRKNVHLITFAKSKMHEDGVNSCRYTVVNVTRHQLYTKISVDIGRPEDDLEKLSSIGGN
ncbi:beta-1,4-galactosyltransferase 1-like isoform X2 [Ambystoma mexicanum]|uniref:beta-1,4-galactosyltransferase 1-like isoform X2 n=1 Tax=Ambystoma mexicanum TaxID=8296 RepID=UPI0037E8F451